MSRRLPKEVGRGDATIALDRGLQDSVTPIFERLHRSLGGLVAVGLGDAPGLPIAFDGPTSDREAATAMASLLVSAAQRAAQILGLPGVLDILIDAEGYTVLVRPVADRFTLLAILKGDANLGHARLLAQSCSDDISVALEGA